MEALKILLLSVAGAAMYGVSHDQITARVCVEYFTIGHPSVFDTDSPTLLALGWGVIATWWVGLILGIFLAISARAGSRPKVAASSLVVPMGFLLLRVGGVAVLAGMAGYYAASQGWIRLLGPIADRLDPRREWLYLAVAWAHGAAYAMSALEGLGMVVRTYKRRGNQAIATSST
jgi:hypothetical protein